MVFTLPGSSALGTAFDSLVTSGLPEVLRFVIEYTGDTSFVRVIPRAGGPQIQGTSAIVVRPGIAATVEITRTSGTISSYVFQAIGQIGDVSPGTADAIKLINPATAVWNANDGGTLPTTGVVKGNAYRVANAPADGSGRFGEVMEDGDWVVWEGETFTAWSTEPHAWFVLPAHDVRRISALETEFLNDVQESPLSDRNTVIRGANYADPAGEIRLKIYPTRGDYSAADLNTTGDVDEYTDAADQTGILAIRLTGTQATLASVLPTLYVFGEDTAGRFTRLLNLSRDFQYEGDFGAESDYTSLLPINYGAGTFLRIYFGTEVERYTSPNLDINEGNLSDDVQRKLNQTSGPGNVDEQRLAAVETKVDGLFPLTPDVMKLTEWADIFTPAAASEVVEIADGYSLIADYRGSSDRYESAGVTYDDTGTDVVTYSGLGSNLFRAFGLRVTAAADQILMWLVDGVTRIPFIDITAAGNLRVNQYREVTTEGDHVTNQTHFLTRSAGTESITTAPGSVSTYTITNFPAGATEASRTLQIETDVLVNGVDTQAGHIQDLSLPAANEAQVRQNFDVSLSLGPLHGNRQVSFTMAYELRVSGADLVVDFFLITAPSDISIRPSNVATFLNYTAPATTARVDNFVAFTDAGGDYVFSGTTEFLITFHPFQVSNSMQAVAAVIDNAGVTDELNDISTPIPAHTFESVEIPDTIHFRTFSPVHYLRHSDLSHLLTRSGTKWAYGLALLREVSEHKITGELDFDSIVLIAPDDTRYRLTVDNSGTLKTEVVV